MALRLIATCAAGLEDLLAGELREGGARGVLQERGAVAFQGSWPDAWRANWRLRTANRVLVELGSWDAADAESLAAGARGLVTSSQAWDGVSAAELFDPRRTFAVRATSARSRLRDSRWVALRVKDGVADGQRDRHGQRASVHREDPDLPWRVRLLDDRASLLLDTSGTPLDQRGYRKDSGAAPVRESLAAACVLAAEWDGQGPVVDPMCGAGTLLAEAGAWALGLAPGRLRRRWVFERQPGFRPRIWQAIRSEAFATPSSEVVLHGTDFSPTALRAARANLERAGLLDRTCLRREDAFGWDPPAGPGLVMVNPPYGERLTASAEQWPRLGDLLKQRYRGWRAVVLAGDEGRGKHLGLRPGRRIPVRSGPLEARILVLDLY